MLTLLLATAWAAPDQVLHHARLWDGTGAPVQEDSWIAVEDGVFVEVGHGPLPDRLADVPATDLGGRTVTPGLIDTHTHPWAVPGANLRDDSEATRMAARKRGLRAFVACGVTTVLDTGASWEAVETLRGWLADGEPGPEILTLGPVMGPPDGYVNAFLPGHPGIGDLETATAHLDRLVEAGAAGAKLTIEPGYFLPVLPMHDTALQDGIAREAHARDLPLFIHAQHREAQLRALELQPRAVLHMVRDRPGDELPARYVETDTPLVTTLNIEVAPLLHFAPADLDRPLARTVVDPVQRETVLSNDAYRAWERGMAAVSLPHSRPSVQKLAALMLPTYDYIQMSQRRVVQNARRMHEAGVRLVVGSDSGAYDVMPFYFHGVSTVREVVLLGEVGLTPEEALLAGTRDAAALVGMQGQIGVVAAGAVADLVVYDGDPLAEIGDVWTVKWTMRAGEVRTPRGWMEGPGGR
jgi:imidazolonepropionase-like amidohydrolase